MRVAVQTLPDLTGKTLVEAEGIFAEQGFEAVTNRGTYRRWQHADGSIVHMSDKGRIVRAGPPVEGKSYRRRYAPSGELIVYDPSIRYDASKPNTHDTGELVKL